MIISKQHLKELIIIITIIIIIIIIIIINYNTHTLSCKENVWVGADWNCFVGPSFLVTVEKGKIVLLAGVFNDEIMEVW